MDEATKNAEKTRKYRLTCYEDSEPDEPGERVLATFETDTNYPTLGSSSKVKAIRYVHDLLAAVTDFGFSLIDELRRLSQDISKNSTDKGGIELTLFELPISVINLLIKGYNLELRED